MFETLIRDVAQRFGLGDQVEVLLSALMTAIFDERSGGMAGLLEKFRQQGLGDRVTSWLGDAAPTPIEPQQLESVLGANTVSTIAERAGIARGTALSAAAVMLPRLIGLLTPYGEVPTGIPIEVTRYLTNFSQPTGKAADFANVMRAPDTSNSEPSRGGTGWLIWVVLAAILISLGWYFLTRTSPEPAPIQSGTPAAPAPAAIPTADARLSLSNDAGKVTYSGTVGSAADKMRLSDALNAAAGAGNASGAAAVDANTKSASWLSALAAFLPDLMKAPGAKVDFDGNTITLGGTPSDADRATLVTALKNQFSGFALNGIEPVKSDAQKNKEAAADMVKQLNQMSIAFDTGSSSVSASSLDMLKDAAKALEGAPPGTKVEIGGYTDNVGSSKANLKLSDERANAVRAKLVELGVSAEMLSAKGYGEASPIADNTSADGRAKNRRMEFTVIE